jgi:hypothetical protein
VWLILSSVHPIAKTLWDFLAAHLNPARGEREAWPTKDTIAKFLGLKQARSIDPYVSQLVGIGALQTRTVRYAGGMRQRIVYRVNNLPPEGYDGPATTGDYYDRTGPTTAPKPQVTPDVQSSAPPKVPPTPSEVQTTPPTVGKFQQREVKNQKTSSSSVVTEPTPRAREASGQEEEFTPEIKTWVMTLPWYGRKPGTPKVGVTRSQLRDIAREVTRLVAEGAHLPVLRSELIAGTERGVRDIVGVYLHRLRREITADLVRRPEPETAAPTAANPAVDALGEPVPSWRDLPVPEVPKTPQILSQTDYTPLSKRGDWCRDSDCERFSRRRKSTGAPCACARVDIATNPSPQPQTVVTRKEPTTAREIYETIKNALSGPTPLGAPA